MGIDIHLFNFLRYANKFGDFKKTLTLGRQEIHTDINYINNHIKKSFYQPEKYCESLLLTSFGSTSADSIDNSDYEGANIISDLNRPINSIYFENFDTIIDGGCIEHIFDVPTAILNIAKMVTVGGQIIHALPANNFCGHGFWQFSPELFFSLYSNKNGFKDTECFLADLKNTNIWTKVSPPQNGDRVNITSSNPLYVLVRTIKTRKITYFDNIQQSDYISSWDAGEIAKNQKPSSYYLNEFTLDLLN
jgi:hypothetical protein